MTKETGPGHRGLALCPLLGSQTPGLLLKGEETTFVFMNCANHTTYCLFHFPLLEMSEAHLGLFVTCYPPPSILTLDSDLITYFLIH